MIWVIKFIQYLSSKVWKSKSNLSETVQVSSCGPVKIEEMESGSALIKTYLLEREPNTLIRLSLGPNTITIRTILVRPSSNGTTFNTTNQDFFLIETASGT